MEIEKMEAGRELDMIVAGKVMGWVWGPVDDGIYKGTISSWFKAGTTDRRPSAIIRSQAPRWSADLVAAWEVADKLRGFDNAFLLVTCRYGGTYSGGAWIAYFGDEPEVIVNGSHGNDVTCRQFWIDLDWTKHAVGVADTAPLAICRAALALQATLDTVAPDPV